MKIYPSQYEEIVRLYSVELIPMKNIAAKYGASRMSIWKILHSKGVETRKGVASQISTTCTQCGNTIKKTRSLFKLSKFHFCDINCYHAFIRTKGNPIIENLHKEQLQTRAEQRRRGMAV